MKALLTLRAIVEGLIGLLFLLNVPVQLVKIPRVIAHDSSYNIAVIAGALVGIALSGILGYLLLRDALKLVRRISSKSVA